MPSAASTIVAVVAFDRISPFHLGVPCMVFDDGHGDGRPRFELRVCADSPGRLRTDAGFDFHVSDSLDGLRDADIVIVPAWPDPDQRPPGPLLDALRAAHARGACVVGLCLGTYVLAEAGLLDGRPATTHWACSEHFARRYPQVALRTDVLYVDDGDVLTSAGTAAAIDCCLHLLRREHGAEAAARVARRMVVSPHRQGGQAQYVERPLPESPGDERLAGVIEWALRHLDHPHRLDDLAGRALMSRRTFTRRFRQATGATVHQWLLDQRLARAQRLLETTDQPLEAIAARTGFGSAVSLRQRFTARFKLPPSAWRREFRGG